jgi:putative transposase
VEAPQAWKWSSYRGTCGIAQPATCLTTDWVLAQFAEVTDKAQKQYRQFVKDGIDGDLIWRDLKYQVLLGDDDFVSRYAEVAGGIEKLTEVPKAQRPSARPSLEQLFPPYIEVNRLKRDQRVVEAVELHSYSQKAVADHLQLHYSSISRILGSGKGKRVF